MSEKKFDRSRFKPTQMNVLKEKEEEVKEAVGVTDYSLKRPSFLEVKAGSNKFRLYPGLDGKPFVVAKSITWLEVEVETGEEGKKKKEKKRIPIFNAKVHAGWKKDLVDEYVKALKTYADENIQDDDDREEYLKPLNDWKTGIKYKTTWICYADKIEAEKTTFGRLELKPAVMKKLNELSAGSDDPEDIIETDPFTDPDNGRSIIIKYDPDATQAANYYSVSIDLKRVRVLDDENLQQLADVDELSDIYENCFAKEDFEKQLEGIRNFDTQNDFGIFELDSFLDTVQELKKLSKGLPSKDDKKDDKKEEKVEKKKSDSPFKEDDEGHDGRGSTEEEQKEKPRSSRLSSLRDRVAKDED